MNSTQFVVNRLRKILPLSEYGQGSAKSFDSLSQEILSGECEIQWQDGKPIRVIRVLAIEVSDLDGNHLYEAYQEFSDGRRRERGLWGVSEKIKPGEDLGDAVVRAVYEELGVTADSFSFEIDPQVETEDKESPSYPGLLTRYIRYSATVLLSDGAVKSEYVEIQPDKKTVFVWR